MRILITGSRNWDDRESVLAALDKVRTDADLWSWDYVVVHGGALGVDTFAGDYAESMGMAVEVHPARDFETPLLRNQHMVDLGAEVCLAFADRWASGTGHCARAARKAGIRTIDMGVSTRVEDRP